MKVVKENRFSNIFPMLIVCKRVVDSYGFSYGKDKDFCGSEIEIEAEDIKKHGWFKYPDYEGVDYGIVCPVCGKFIVIDKDKIPDKVMNESEEIRLSH